MVDARARVPAAVHGSVSGPNNCQASHALLHALAGQPAGVVHGILHRHPGLRIVDAPGEWSSAVRASAQRAQKDCAPAVYASVMAGGPCVLEARTGSGKIALVCALAAGFLDAHAGGATVVLASRTVEQLHEVYHALQSIMPSTRAATRT